MGRQKIEGFITTATLECHAGFRCEQSDCKNYKRGVTTRGFLNPANSGVQEFPQGIHEIVIEECCAMTGSANPQITVLRQIPNSLIVQAECSANA